MKKPLVSCVVPVFNGERYLAESLDSILGQTYRPIEVIVVDDGSTDGTADVIAGYDGQVRSVWQSNAGPAAAINHGIRIATGDLVACLAADDLWQKEKLTRQVEQFEANGTLDACVTHIQNFWVPEMNEEAERFKNHRIAEAMPGYLCVTMLARAEVFRTVGLFDETLQHGNDLDWFMRAREKNIAIALLPDVLVHRRLHDGNRSRHLASNSRDTILDILKARIDRNRDPDERTVG
ncbi:MAG: glycosyltransferase [Rhodothermales bacterium]